MRRRTHPEFTSEQPARCERLRDEQRLTGAVPAASGRRKMSAHVTPRRVPHLIRYLQGALDTLELSAGEDRTLRECTGVAEVRAQPGEWPIALNWGEGQKLLSYAAEHPN